MEKAVWRCGCGQVEARIPGTGARVVCYCQSCRSFVERLGKGERLDAAGGSDLLQVAPEDVEIVKGANHLRYMKVTERGPLRWYTTCCATPMANTLSNRAVAFCSFQVHDVMPKAGLPEISARVHLKGATAQVEGPRGTVRPLVLGLLARTVRGWVTGGWRRNPFFDPDGKPIAPREDPTISGS